MNAVYFHPPGGPDKLKYEQGPIPNNLQPNEMLIKVHAASVIWPELYWPIYQDKKTGEHPPQIPCHDFSGTVVRTGSDVEKQSDIKVGSEVYAFNTAFGENGLRKYNGAAADYVVSDLDSAILKPKNMSLLEAASVPLSALTAWQALHDHAKLTKGQRLLITGAAGATGLWALQFAKLLGATVIGTASSKWSFKTLKELGIDEIIDYKKQNLAESVADIDVVLDTVGGDTLAQAVKTMKPDGKLIDIVTFDVHEKVPKGVDAKFFIVSMNKEQLSEITRMIEEGKLKTFIDSEFSLDRAREAFEYGAKGHAHGKILISVGSD
jgi:NADPH:quinone reductase-like Zn-dependent oxidoreductase